MNLTITRHLFLAPCCLLLFLPMTIRAADPLFDKTNLFEARKDGYAHYRIPGIVVTAKGSVLAYCEARKRVASDWGTIDILMRRSTDEGKTWGQRKKIVTPPKDIKKNPAAVAQGLGDSDEVTMNNPVAIIDHESGTTHFVYCAEYARCFYMRSDDDGVTWSNPVEITSTFEAFRKKGYAWKVLATGPGHAIKTTKGRIIVPVWMSTGTGGHAHRPSVNSVIYSDDSGKSWHAGDIVSGEHRPKNPSETLVIELANGDVMLNYRHESFGHGRAVTVSSDGATNWSPIRFDDNLPEPICMGAILRLTSKPKAKRNRILFCNPNNPIDRQRRNVTVKLTYDECKTWPISKSIEPGVSGYSDLAAGPDGTIYCFYERGSVEASHYDTEALCVARFNLEWLTEGIDHGE